jgi:hypothetical protein
MITSRNWQLLTLLPSDSLRLTALTAEGQVLIKSCHYSLLSGIRLAFGGQQNIQILITKEPKDDITNIRSKRVMLFNFPIKTRRASQQGAEKRTVTV